MPDSLLNVHVYYDAISSYRSYLCSVLPRSFHSRGPILNPCHGLNKIELAPQRIQILHVVYNTAYRVIFLAITRPWGW